MALPFFKALDEMGADRGRRESEGVFCELGVARFKTEVSLNATQLQ